MGFVTVKFLGEEYQVSETINEFLSYDTLLTPMRIKVLNTATEDIKRDARLSWNADTMINHIHYTVDEYRKMIEDSVELLVKKLLELGVYDVTSDELLKDVTTIADIDKIETDTFATLSEEGRKIDEMQTAGIERAYYSATSNITGSGMAFFTNSFSALTINSMVEKNIIISQAKKADKEYEEAVRNLSTSAKNALDTLYRQVMIQEFYPSIVQSVLKFCDKIMSIFLLELTARDKFDFDSVEKYDMQKADRMLKNIAQVPDKVVFLKQVFLICPFSLDVYESCLNYELLDWETFETAKYFGMGDALAEKIDLIIKNDFKNIEKIAPLISILALYRGIDEIMIRKKIYESLLENIEATYKEFNIALSDKRRLDEFIRDCIDSEVKEVIKKTREDIFKIIDKKMLSVVSEKQCSELVGIGILSLETIRMPGSYSTTIKEVNSEIKNALGDSIMEYIEEAKRRLDAYNRAKDIYEKEWKQKSDEISDLRSKKSNLSFLAFNKKKKISAIIDTKANEILEFKKTNEPKDLLAKFEEMYRLI